MRRWRAALRAVGIAGALLAIAVGPAHRSMASAAEAVARTQAPTVVVNGGKGASFDRFVAASDGLYVDNAGDHRITRYILNGLPYAELFTSVMRAREQEQGVIIGRPRDLFLSDPRLLVFDDRGSLWSYWGPTYQRSIVPLRLQRNQGTPTALTLHGSALILLDPDRHQIWRYRQSGAGWATVPVPMLAHPSALLAGGRRLAATPTALLVLRADGRVVRVPWDHPAQAALVRGVTGATGIYANPASDRYIVTTAHRVIELDASGARLWQTTVEDAGGASGKTLRDVAMSPANQLYVLTATRVLRVPGHVPTL